MVKTGCRRSATAPNPIDYFFFRRLPIPRFFDAAVSIALFSFRKMLLAFSNSFFLSAVSFLPARLMNICTILIADPIPPGETSLRAIVFATTSAGLVNVPFGGNVDSVLTFADHFRFLVAAI